MWFDKGVLGYFRIDFLAIIAAKIIFFIVIIVEILGKRDNDFSCQSTFLEDITWFPLTAANDYLACKKWKDSVPNCYVIHFIDMAGTIKEIWEQWRCCEPFNLGGKVYGVNPSHVCFSKLAPTCSNWWTIVIVQRFRGIVIKRELLGLIAIVSSLSLFVYEIQYSSHYWLNVRQH